MTRETIGVLGAGVMGTGVAHALAASGFKVTLVDVDQTRADAARANIEKNIRMYQLLHKMDQQQADGIMGRIQATADASAVYDADFLIENITEKWALKEALHRTLSQNLKPGTPVVANTSAIPIAHFAKCYADPARVAGMHFMNPVPLMPMVEVIRAPTTSEQTLAACRALIEGMGKQSIVVNDSPGFITNRVMMLTVNEAIFCLHEKVAASAKDIDRLFMSCFGHKMGPLATTDLIGVDTVLLSLEVLHHEFKDDKYRPCPLLREMVAAGRLGRKNGKGFYDYDDAE
ncbi:3-hydroxyacyl-CoA dehydrogenase family protein [Acanthopleuribacter pedis]|uniref:3-hydroxyacyl-CoA dehydrogenase family protein n=1 Tax=Acanthopleuribacter pedis TaxID=442870 RepID=A0A8J7QBK3_9BACT|nr:3-hydroxyacyl-CoA dehydrogenase family protein [Acanthopleuribacter pedis]MBO1323122.1 3-hydroxyacyl-CoA dehydrogenase family protein [Acanthopleuribacter pedis]